MASERINNIVLLYNNIYQLQKVKSFYGRVYMKFLSNVTTFVVVTAFLLTMVGWMLWAAKWVLSLLGVM